MKIVKLDRRFKQHKQYGHTVGMMFDRYSAETRNIEFLCEDIFGSPCWDRSGSWAGYFGSYRKPVEGERVGGYRTYWITFREESAISLVLLKLEQNG